MTTPSQTNAAGDLEALLNVRDWIIETSCRAGCSSWRGAEIWNRCDCGRAEAIKALSTPAPQVPDKDDELDLYDEKVQEGISWTMRQWGEALGLTTWTQGDGSESVEGDVGAEIHTILVDAGLRDPETNEMARLAAQVPDKVGDGAMTMERIQSAMLAATKKVRAESAHYDEVAALDKDIARMESGPLDMGETGSAIILEFARLLTRPAGVGGQEP